MKLVLAALVSIAACDAPSMRKLPGAPLTPQLAARTAPRACGDDIAFAGATTPSLRFRYDYDALGRLAVAIGTFIAGGPDDNITWTYDHLGHTTHYVENRGGGTPETEVVADYDTLGDLVDYTWSSVGSPTAGYSYRDFDGSGQPVHETYTAAGQLPVNIQLDYDSSDRLARVTGSDGTITTYTYDDDGRTLTIDTDAGAWAGVIEYDDRARELSEHWDGNAPGVIATSTTYSWSGDQLLTMTYRSGSQAARRDLATVEVDTYRYDCR
jgi:YD repeat-containing protein